MMTYCPWGEVKELQNLNPWKSLKGPAFLIKIVGDTFLDDESLKSGG